MHRENYHKGADERVAPPDDVDDAGAREDVAANWRAGAARALVRVVGGDRGAPHILYAIVDGALDDHRAAVASLQLRRGAVVCARVI